MYAVHIIYNYIRSYDHNNSIKENIMNNYQIISLTLVTFTSRLIYQITSN